METYTDTIEEPGVYCYQVSAYDYAGNESERSEIVCTEVSPTPAPLEALIVSALMALLIIGIHLFLSIRK